MTQPESGSMPPTAAECIIFSSACSIVFNIDHMLSHKATLNKLESINVRACFVAKMKLEVSLEINNRRKLANAKDIGT